MHVHIKLSIYYLLHNIFLLIITLLKKPVLAVWKHIWGGVEILSSTYIRKSYVYCHHSHILVYCLHEQCHWKCLDAGHYTYIGQNIVKQRKSNGWHSQLRWDNFNNLLIGAPYTLFGTNSRLETLLHQQNLISHICKRFKSVCSYMDDVVSLGDCHCNIQILLYFDQTTDIYYFFLTLIYLHIYLLLYGLLPTHIKILPHHWCTSLA